MHNEPHKPNHLNPNYETVQFPSSQLCAVCGSKTGKKALHVREFDCLERKAKNIDRDISASINIRNYGIGQLDNRNTAI